uniref:Uncharacterized protein n=1 Tax=Oryza punctata TaxID=4537 RepID=A0A0E0KML8_ORYPU
MATPSCCLARMLDRSGEVGSGGRNQLKASGLAATTDRINKWGLRLFWEKQQNGRCTDTDVMPAAMFRELDSCD